MSIGRFVVEISLINEWVVCIAFVFHIPVDFQIPVRYVTYDDARRVKIGVIRVVNVAVMIVILVSVVNVDCKDGNISNKTSSIYGGWSIQPLPLSVRGSYRFGARR